MIYGLTIVRADGPAIEVDLLDGNISAIRTIDRTPDGGVSFESLNAGRHCNTESFPTRMRWKGGKDQPILDFDRAHLINVSERAKALIEEWEPGVHQFVPVDFVDAKGDVLERRYALVICNRLDSVDREHTTFVLRRGKAWRAASDLAARGEFDEIPPRVDPSKPSKIVFNRAQIGRAHLWRDKHIDMGGPFVSDAFAAALRRSDLTGLDIKPEGGGMEEVQ